MGSAGTLEPPGWETAPAPVARTPNKNPQSRWVSPLALAAGPPGAETGRLRAGELRRDPGLSRSSAAVLTGRPGKPGSRLPHLWSGTFPPEVLSRRLSPVQGSSDVTAAWGGPGRPAWRCPPWAQARAHLPRAAEALPCGGGGTARSLGLRSGPPLAQDPASPLSPARCPCTAAGSPLSFCPKPEGPSGSERGAAHRETPRFSYAPGVLCGTRQDGINPAGGQIGCDWVIDRLVNETHRIVRAAWLGIGRRERAD